MICIFYLNKTFTYFSLSKGSELFLHHWPILISKHVELKSSYFWKSAEFAYLLEKWSWFKKRNHSWISPPCISLTPPSPSPILHMHTHIGETFALYVYRSWWKSHWIFPGCCRCRCMTSGVCHSYSCLHPFLPQTCIHRRNACESMQTVTEP